MTALEPVSILIVRSSRQLHEAKDDNGTPTTEPKSSPLSYTNDAV